MTDGVVGHSGVLFTFQASAWRGGVFRMTVSFQASHRLWRWALAVPFLLPLFWVMTSLVPLNRDAYASYSLSSAYGASFENIVRVGGNTLGPLLPLVMLFARQIYDPGTDMHAIRVFQHALSGAFILLTWFAGLWLVSARTSRWLIAAIYSAAFLLMIDWSLPDYSFLDGELLSAPFLIAIVLFAPDAGFGNAARRGRLYAVLLCFAAVYFTKLQAVPIAAFTFVFAAALRQRFDARDALLRLCAISGLFGVLTLLPVLFDAQAQSLVPNAVLYLSGRNAQTPLELKSALHFFSAVGAHMAGLVFAIALFVASSVLLRRSQPKIGAWPLQSETFALCLVVLISLCMIPSHTFFTHYALLYLPVLPLLFSLLADREDILERAGWLGPVAVGAAALSVLFQIHIAYSGHDHSQAAFELHMQKQAELIRAACPDAKLPVMVHGWDHSYYAALGSYPEMYSMDTIQPSGYEGTLVAAYRTYLLSKPILIVDVMATSLPAGPRPRPEAVMLENLLGPAMRNYRPIPLPGSVIAYCPRAPAPPRTHRSDGR